MKKILLLLFCSVLAISCQKTHRIFLDEMDISQVQQGWSEAKTNTNLSGDSLSVNGVRYERGIGTHAISEIEVALDKKALAFHAWVGIDDKVAKVNGGTVIFKVYCDDVEVFNSNIMTSNEDAKEIAIDLTGVSRLLLVCNDAYDDTHHDHGDWLNAYIDYKGKKTPYIYYDSVEKPYCLTPKASGIPVINSAKAYGARPRNPIIYRLAVSGQRPMIIKANNLPKGLILDTISGVLSGNIAVKGVYPIEFTASNSKGSVVKTIQFIIGDKICLTPPMGWNSWNVWGLSVDADKVKQAADAFINSGLADYGYSYVNIDDGWEAAVRTNGVLLPNDKFGDIKALAAQVHSLGFKLGIYSSPGLLTCGRFVGSYGAEAIDAKTWAEWGIDYLKYDYCSYKNFAPFDSLDKMKEPYIKMYKALAIQKRDIVYSLCQYGKGNVWRWGEAIGGNLWRTTGDITDTWHSVKTLGFGQDTLYSFAKPGAWNDPDMLVVGKLGWGPNLRNSRLTPHEQYTHITLWSMLSAPLLLGCDLSQIDTFTLNLLTNPEVIAVNQDYPAIQAFPIYKTENEEIWLKPMSDSSMVVGLFNLSRKEAEMVLDFEYLNLPSNKDYSVRDLWRQSDEGYFQTNYRVSVPRHGCKLVKITAK